MATTTTECVNLMERFGERYRITLDEAYDSHRRWRENLDPWYMQIPCRFGTVYPHGGTMLAVSVDSHPKAAKGLSSLPCCRLYLDGERDKTYLFDVKDFPQVAAVVIPKRKARLTEEQRLAAAERLKAYAFQPRADAATA